MKRYEIAGLQVDMETFGRTLQQAQPYETEVRGEADFTICCNTQKIMEDNPQMKDPDMAQYMGSGAVFARHLLRHNGFQLHSSAVLLSGKAYLFSAPSGTGKSTHTEKWQRLFGARYLNDDKPALRRTEDGWIAYGTPWSGKHDLSVPECAPLGGIAFLERGEENKILRLQPADAVPLLISQSLRYLSAGQMTAQLELLDKLLREVPVWRLVCRNDDDAAILSHGEMVR